MKILPSKLRIARGGKPHLTKAFNGDLKQKYTVEKPCWTSGQVFSGIENGSLCRVDVGMYISGQ
jgi:hypothetical protein